MTRKKVPDFTLLLQQISAWPEAQITGLERMMGDRFRIERIAD